MKQLFIKLYDLITAPLYRRLARDLTLQLQEISQSYIDQHEMLTAKMLDELLRLNIRVEQTELGQLAKQEAKRQLEEPVEPANELSEETIFDLINQAAKSLDVVDVCTRNNIPLAVFYELEGKYRGLDPAHIRRVKLLEATNIELRRLLTQLMHRQSMDRELQPAKPNGNNGHD
jgi:hypothetical protein